MDFYAFCLQMVFNLNSIDLFNFSQFLFLLMIPAKKLESESYIREIKKLIKPAYFIEIQNAIEADDEDQIETVVFKYLRKNEAQKYFPLILFGLRKLRKGSKQLASYKSKPRILEYLHQRLSQEDYQQVWDVIEEKNYDLCCSMLKELLRYEEAEEILVHIKRLIVENSKKLDVVVDYRKTQKVKNNYVENNKTVSKSSLPNETLAQKTKRQKRETFNELEILLEDQSTFNQVKMNLENGKIKKAEEAMKLIVGKKFTDAFMKKFEQFFGKKINYPLESAILLHTKQDGIRFFEIQTQQIMDIPQDEITNILIVGMTGVGKSTYLNALVNYFMGVDMEDDFRYVVSRDMFKNGDGKSSTDKVMIYGIPKQGIMKKAVRLIDIPGLGDTDGIKKDKTNLKMIKERIQKTIPFINQIIYIFKSSDSKITKQAEYVMGQIMGIFAKDMESKIIFVLTFADNDKPTVVPQLQFSFGQLITQIKKRTPNWYVKVNNSAMFKKIDLQNHIDVCFFLMGQKCLEQTANIMQASEKVSTKNTVMVMSQRQELQQSAKAFNEIIQASFTQQEEIKRVLKQITLKNEELSKIGYKVKYKEEKIESLNTDKNVTSCLNCKYSCHKDCAYGSNQEKQNCISMDKGFCKVCPNKCRWTEHINDHIILKRVFVEVEKTNDDLFKKYQISKLQKNKKEQLILKLIMDYSTILVSIKDYCDRLRTINQELSLLQLRGVNHTTIVEYIQMMIEHETLDKKQGYIDRVKEYQLLKQEEERLQSILSQNENSRLDEFQQIIKNRITSLIPDKQLADKINKTVLNAYEQIRIAKEDINFIKKNKQLIVKQPDSSTVASSISNQNPESNKETKSNQLSSKGNSINARNQRPSSQPKSSSNKNQNLINKLHGYFNWP